jgi:hypothetical protein
MSDTEERIAEDGVSGLAEPNVFDVSLLSEALPTAEANDVPDALPTAEADNATNSTTYSWAGYDWSPMLQFAWDTYEEQGNPDWLLQTDRQHTVFLDFDTVVLRKTELLPDTNTFPVADFPYEDDKLRSWKNAFIGFINHKRRRATPTSSSTWTALPWNTTSHIKFTFKSIPSKLFEYAYNQYVAQRQDDWDEGIHKVFLNPEIITTFTDGSQLLTNSGVLDSICNCRTLRTGIYSMTSLNEHLPLPATSDIHFGLTEKAAMSDLSTLSDAVIAYIEDEANDVERNGRNYILSVEQVRHFETVYDVTRASIMAKLVSFSRSHVFTSSSLDASVVYAYDLRQCGYCLKDGNPDIGWKLASATYEGKKDSKERPTALVTCEREEHSRRMCVALNDAGKIVNAYHDNEFITKDAEDVDAAGGGSD